MKQPFHALAAVSVVLFTCGAAQAQGAFQLDHFNVYNANSPAPPVSNVLLTDQFGRYVTALGRVQLFMAPASKNDERIQDLVGHLSCRPVSDPRPAAPDVIVTNQFGEAQLSVGQARLLCTPTEKLITPGPIVIDHYQCYDASGPPVGAAVSIADQFQIQQGVDLLTPVLFCNPVDKNGEGVTNPNDHLTCYDYAPVGTPAGEYLISNQFSPDPFPIEILNPFALCVPSAKQPIGPEPVDHFSVYRAAGPAGPQVSIADQFGGPLLTDVGPTDYFMIPADKNGEGIFDPISHLTCHQIPEGDLPRPQVLVDNQFGRQILDVGPPRELCVPTEKLKTPGIVTIDHFRCYDAFGPPVDANVDWVDQFQGVAAFVREPFMLCNPADKNGEGITSPDDHLVCYRTETNGSEVGPLDISNQFNQGEPIQVLEPFALCVPSSKTILPLVPILDPAAVVGLVALLGVAAILTIARVRRRNATPG